MRLIVLPVVLLGLAALASCQTYYIVDAKHGRSIVAGNHYDGHLYHQDPFGRPNAKWLLEPVHGQPGFFFIRDTLHYRYIVAGNNYDGRRYHQDSGNRPNAKWRLLPFTDTYGSTTYEIFDQKHNRAIVAGNNADNNLYHQWPDLRPNARWALIRN